MFFTGTYGSAIGSPGLKTGNLKYYKVNMTLLREFKPTFWRAMLPSSGYKTIPYSIVLHPEEGSIAKTSV